jgi:hypothetical protein
MSSVPEKTKADRLKETIRLLKGLQANQLSEWDGSYKEIKAILTKWVEDGDAVEAKVDLFRQNRIAHISLPKGADRPATIGLKVIREVDPDMD